MNRSPGGVPSTRVGTRQNLGCWGYLRADGVMEGSTTRPADDGVDPAQARVRKIIHVDMDAFYASVERATIRSCAASLSRSAARRPAASLQRRATRPVRSACARRFPQ